MKNKDWIRSIYSCIKEISDKDFQERIWIKGLGPEISSYTEVMCMLYDDLNFEKFIKNYKELELTYDLASYLEGLNIRLREYEEKESDIEIVNDHKWIEITEYAKKGLLMFDPHIR